MTGLDIILLVVAVVAVIAGIAAVLIVSSRYREKLVSAKADARTAEALRIREKEIHEKAVKDLKDNQAHVIEAVKNELKLESEKALKEREASLKAEAEETLKALTRVNTGMNEETISKFIDTLNVSESVKAELHALAPNNYTGI